MSNTYTTYQASDYYSTQDEMVTEKDNLIVDSPAAPKGVQPPETNSRVIVTPPVDNVTRRKPFYEISQRGGNGVVISSVVTMESRDLEVGGEENGAKVIATGSSLDTLQPLETAASRRRMLRARIAARKAGVSSTLGSSLDSNDLGDITEDD